MINIGQSAAKF